ncbi:MAG: FAD-dependent oxidoreductase, partial [Bacteroidales bacterium]|nr:FAD-dependent oxidoreductase [Bacteroidales bacterium]
DSHNCERVVVEKDGKVMVKNEGDVEIGGGKPYPLSYRSITPKREECTNLLVPVCLSSSHIAFGSIRMEPVFLELGQVAGIAACLAGKNPVQTIDITPIQQKVGYPAQ